MLFIIMVCLTVELACPILGFTSPSSRVKVSSMCGSNTRDNVELAMVTSSRHDNALKRGNVGTLLSNALSVDFKIRE
jgi:hypothetical protein